MKPPFSSNWTTHFGEYDAELVRVEDRSLFPAETEPGMMFEGIPEGGSEDDMEFFTVTDIAGDKVVLMAIIRWLAWFELRGQ